MFMYNVLLKIIHLLEFGVFFYQLYVDYICTIIQKLIKLMSNVVSETHSLVIYFKEELHQARES